MYPLTLTAAMDLRQIIRSFPDWPKQGVIFRDIMPLLKNPQALSYTVNEIIKQWKSEEIDLIAGIESRGFIFGALIAQNMQKGFIAIRKEGKLPGETVKVNYTIEYGSATMEIQKDAVERGQRVLIVDDLLATGGTAKAAADLIERLGGVVVGFAFVVELLELKGREKLKGYKVTTLITY
ncbi:MAG: adenine phosphoribosyltransferase [Nitrososphaerales archaeon]